MKRKDPIGELAYHIGKCDGLCERISGSKRGRKYFSDRGMDFDQFHRDFLKVISRVIVAFSEGKGNDTNKRRSINR